MLTECLCVESDLSVNSNKTIHRKLQVKKNENVKIILGKNIKFMVFHCLRNTISVTNEGNRILTRDTCWYKEFYIY